MSNSYVKYVSVIVVIILAYFYRRHNLPRVVLEIPSVRDVFNYQDISLNITVLGTNDLHSTFNGHGLQSYPDAVSGGYSRLVWLINDVRKQREAEGDLVLTLDAGDWYSGSLFDNLAADPQTSAIPQMEFFAEAHFDAIILGNHDFDRYESALYIMLDKARKLNLDINIIASNLLPFPETSKFRTFAEDESGTVKILPYFIKDTAQGRVGVLGYTTPDALFVSEDYRADFQFIGYSHETGLDMASLLELAIEQSAMLKSEHNCDVVVAVLHGGHKDGENHIFAELPNIDIVLGGHTHERYFFRTEEGSLISQCYHSGMYLTSLSVGYNKNDRNLIHRGVDEKYESHVGAEATQCIKVNSKIPADVHFQDKLNFWKKEISRIYKFDPDRIVFKGDLSNLFKNNIDRHINAKVFAEMLTEQYNKWEQKIKPGSNRTYGTFWNKEFLEDEQFIHDSRDVVLTYSDAYNFIFFTATKGTYSFYLNKRHLYLSVQGVFLIQKLVSPLLTACLGGINYDEDMYYGIPIITNMRTTDNIPYDEWPALVKVTVNSIVAPFFWKVTKFSYGFLDNFPTDEEGNPVTLQQSRVLNSPNEIELFLNYLLQNTIDSKLNTK